MGDSVMRVCSFMVFAPVRLSLFTFSEMGQMRSGPMSERCTTGHEEGKEHGR